MHGTGAISQQSTEDCSAYTRRTVEREKEITLLSDCLERVQRKRPFEGRDEALIPVAEYLDTRRFEAERSFLRRSLNVVGHTSQIASAGDFMTGNVLGTPVLFVRGTDGRARAFVNVCRHRGATVESRERGHCRRFVCPYHAWTYETDGSLAGVRHREGFPTLDVEHTSLVELSSLEAGGLLWVCPEPGVTAPTPDAADAALHAELDWIGSSDSTVFASQSKTWNANWKLIVDGGLESYHFKIAHRDTIAGFFADNVSTFELLGDHIRSVLPRLSILELAEQPQSEWDIRKHTHLLYSVAPNASVLVQERHFELVVMTPIAVDRTRIEIMSIARKPGPEGFSDKAKDFLSTNHAFTNKTLDEDFAIAEQIQRGMSTGANEFFRFATFEGAITEWHARLRTRLRL